MISQRSDSWTADSRTGRYNKYNTYKPGASPHFLMFFVPWPSRHLCGACSSLFLISLWLMRCICDGCIDYVAAEFTCTWIFSSAFCEDSKYPPSTLGRSLWFAQIRRKLSATTIAFWQTNRTCGKKGNCALIHEDFVSKGPPNFCRSRLHHKHLEFSVGKLRDLSAE